VAPNDTIIRKKLIRKETKERRCSLSAIFLEGLRKTTRNFSRTQYLLNMTYDATSGCSVNSVTQIEFTATRTFRYNETLKPPSQRKSENLDEEKFSRQHEVRCDSMLDIQANDNNRCLRNQLLNLFVLGRLANVSCEL
jgi:hypothetical protein